MKKIVAFLCLLALCLPLCACSASLATEETTTQTEEDVKTAEDKKETGEIIYPGSFSVGYARIDISGTLPVPIFESTAKSIHDPLYLTCTAVCDGENVALLMSADLRAINRSCVKKSAEIIKKQFGIPAENIIINCTHTHNAPIAGNYGEASLRWTANYYKQLPIVVENALRDLDEVEGTFAGTDHTEGITFVRRYLMPDGTYDTNPGNKKVVDYESPADTTLQTLRFDRKTKKDVLMINYQTHHGGTKYGGQVSADFIAPYRETVEKEMDCLFAYHQGAGGNINFLCSIPKDKKYASFIEAIDGFMITTRGAISKEEPVSIGEIQTLSQNVTAVVQKESEEVVKNAKKVMKADEKERGTLAAQYGFESWRHANSTIDRNENKGETENIPLTAVTFGEIAFCAFPYEMFDTNGKEVRDGSPFKITYICSQANGTYGYIPSALAFPHGTYEVNACSYVAGTGEQLVQGMLSMLNECKSAS